MKVLISQWSKMDIMDKIGQAVSLPLNLFLILAALIAFINTNSIEYLVWSAVFAALIYLNWRAGYS